MRPRVRGSDSFFSSPGSISEESPAAPPSVDPIYRPSHCARRGVDRARVRDTLSARWRALLDREPLTQYKDRLFKGSMEEYLERLRTSATLYVGNVSFYTSEEQIWDLSRARAR